MVSAAQLKRLFPSAKANLVDAIVRGWPKAEAAGISTPQRTRQFLSNIGAETGGLRSISESMTYTKPERLMQVWPSRFKTKAQAQPYVRQPKKLAIKVYGGRMGNAPAPSEDGWIYRGGGMMQTTGRDGYRALGFENNPAALRDPDKAFDSAVKEWVKRGCNALADQGNTTAIRKAINGGTNGLAEVQAYLKKAEAIWTGTSPAPKPAAFAEDTIRAVQQKLHRLGYTEVGRADGKMGNMTRTAILAFRLDNNLPLEPVIDDALLQALTTAGPRHVAKEREEASAAEVRQEVPEVQSNFLNKVISAITAVFSAISALIAGIFQQFETAKGYIDPMMGYLTGVPGWVWLVLIAIVAGVIFVVSRQGEQKGVEAFQAGARR